MEVDKVYIPIVDIPLEGGVKLSVKREDLVHLQISGNKYWKMFYNVKTYLAREVKNPLIITFGGAYSNHIAAASAVGEKYNIKTLGVIRGEELEAYRDKEKITRDLQEKCPEALIVPEGGTNELAVEGVKHMLDERTKEFDYICTAVGTGGTISGLSKFAEEHQKILGFKVVDDPTLEERIQGLSGRKNFTLFDAHDGRYGKIIDENIQFINDFYERYDVPLDPIYTGKMMRNLMKLINEGYFPEGSRILAFHTGGLQGILGANEWLKKTKKELIKIKFN